VVQHPDRELVVVRRGFLRHNCQAYGADHPESRFPAAPSLSASPSTATSAFAIRPCSGFSVVQRLLSCYRGVPFFRAGVWVVGGGASRCCGWVGVGGRSTLVGSPPDAHLHPSRFASARCGPAGGGS